MFFFSASRWSGHDDIQHEDRKSRDDYVKLCRFQRDFFVEETVDVTEK
jgi:hypothetical protein